MNRGSSEQPEVGQFVKVAQDFCELIETCPQREVRGFLLDLEQALPLLMVGVLRLPRTESDGPKPSEFEHLEVWKSAVHKVGDCLAAHRYYWDLGDLPEVMHPEKPRLEDITVGDLADDLADIYCDLRRGLDPWDAAETTPGTRQYIVWEWRQMFDIHWGEHLVEALRQVHSLLGGLRVGRSP